MLRLAGLLAAALVLFLAAALWFARETPTQAPSAPRGDGPRSAHTPVSELAETDDRVAATTPLDEANAPAGELLDSGRVVLAGRVLNSEVCGQLDGADGVADIEVVLTEFVPESFNFGGQRRTTRTDATGVFRVEFEDSRPLPSGWRLLVEGAAGLRSAYETVVFEGGPRTRDDLLLVRCPLGNLDGEVVDLADAPLEGVRLSFGQEADRRETISDSEGRFSIRDVRHGWSVEASKPGWVLVARDDARQDDAGDWQFVRVVMAPTAELELHIVDVGGRPQPGVGVKVWISPVERHGPSYGRVMPLQPEQAGGQSDQLGRLLLRDVPARQRLLLRSREDYDREQGGEPCPYWRGGRADR